MCRNETLRRALLEAGFTCPAAIPPCFRIVPAVRTRGAPNDQLL